MGDTFVWKVFIGTITVAGLVSVAACAGPRLATTRPAPAALTSAAQNRDGDHVTVAFSDSARSGSLRVHLLNGAISVKAYSGKEVILDAEPRESRTTSVAATGLHRLQTGSTGLRIEEQNNVMTVQADGRRAVRVNLQVPVRTNLTLHSVNGGSIEVEGVEGDIDIESTNGRITARDVAGAVTAHSTNGSVLVTMC